MLMHAGDPGEAEREIRPALALDPFHPPIWRSEGHFRLTDLGQPSHTRLIHLNT
jgi:hypothetical protein